MSQNMDSLSSTFVELLKSYETISNFSGSRKSEEFVERIANGCKLCEMASNAVNELELFSKNDSIDDLTSTELRYLILPALYGYFTSQKMDNRLATIRLTISLYNEFLRLCNHFSISEAIDTSSLTGTGDSYSSAAARREAKIKQYKEKKALEQKLEELATYVDQPHVDEEIKREYNLTLVRHWVYIAQEELRSLLQEEQLLSMNPDQLKQAREAEKQNPQPMKPFILTRNAVQAAVFGAGYPSLPTMTVEQFYDEQVKLGNLPATPATQVKSERRSGPTVRRIDPSDAEKVAAEEKAAKEDELEDVDDPERLRKARAWDAFKDENRRGSGNRMNRA